MNEPELCKTVHICSRTLHHEVWHEFHQLPLDAPGLPVAVILSLMGFVYGGLHCSMQLLDTDFLICQLLPVLQQVFLEAVDLMRLAGQLSTGISHGLLIVLASVPGFMQCALPFL